jgi:predicted metal-binding membrane protein
MNKVEMNIGQPSVPWWKRLLWRHPEWWMFGLSLMAWVSMTTHFDSAAGFSFAHAHHHQAKSILAAWGAETSGWMLMIVAMMLPLVAGSARDVAQRSLWFRRQRAIVGFLIGYLSVWLLVGIALSLAVSYGRTQRLFDPNILIGLSFIMAAVWQGTSVKQRALFSCHRTRPIAPDGLEADRDCMRYGWMIAGSCVVNCWAWMLFCTLTGHHIVAMLFAAFIGISERYQIRKYIPFAGPSLAMRLTAR